MAIGVMGGTFDPVHVAHLAIAARALEVLPLDRVIFIPAARPPHKTEKDVSPIEHRLQMVRLAVAGDARLGVSDLEARRPLPSYTIETMKELRREFGEEETFYFIMGADSLTQFFTWKDPEALLNACEFVVVPRPGVGMDDADERIRKRAIVLDAPLMDVSSSDIRDRVRRGESIDHLVPPEVSAYISEKKLYS